MYQYCPRNEVHSMSQILNLDDFQSGGQVIVCDIDEPGLVGLLACPTGPGPFPTVIAFGGSSGGLGPSAGWAPALASHGIATLSIAYFAAQGLPAELIRIEVEVVERAARWVRDQELATGDVVAAMGISRGSELALLASVLVDGVGPVVAFSPSGIAWSGLGARGPVDAPAWTFRGDALPYASAAAPAPEFVQPSGPEQPPLELRPLFENTLADPTLWRDAEIPIEQANGPILLVSGEADAMWPSTTMANMIQHRAAERDFQHDVVHLHYPNAGHTGPGVPDSDAETEIRHPLTGATYALGGTAHGNATARHDSWPHVVSFLTNTLTDS
jgi:dienelactone hydrolase